MFLSRGVKFIRFYKMGAVGVFCICVVDCRFIIGFSSNILNHNIRVNIFVSPFFDPRYPSKQSNAKYWKQPHFRYYSSDAAIRAQSF